MIYIFIFITGFHDEGNLIATVITSRSLNVYLIFLLACISQFVGTMLLGTKVATSIVTSIFNFDVIVTEIQKIPAIICAAMIGATAWNIITWVLGIPSSSSHAIIGGLMGPFIIQFGPNAINGSGLVLNVLVPLFLSPIIGYAFGYALYKFNIIFFGKKDMRYAKLTKIFQAFTCVLINAFQGSNDAQKGIGVLALLAISSADTALSINTGTVFFSAVAISLGLILGGFKMIRSVGTKIYGVRPIHSMSAQASSTAVIISASLSGFPVSGTQIVNSAIMGVGAADRPNAVGWEYAKNMLIAWIITIPSAFLLSSFFYSIIRIFR